jgi:hypothetical protein
LKQAFFFPALIVMLLSLQSAMAQADSVLPGGLNEKSLEAIIDKYTNLEEKLDRISEKTIREIQKQEEKLLQKIGLKDPEAAKKLMARAQEKYNRLLQRAGSVGQVNTAAIRNYVPGLDSMQTAFAFLQQSGLPATQLALLGSVTDQIKKLQSEWQAAAEIRRFLKERQEELKEQLDRFGLGKELKAINKKAYYYQQQLLEFRSTLADPSKIEKKILAVVREQPAFRDFMAKNSQLAQLFAVPGSAGTADLPAGLQSRMSVQEQLDGRLPSGTDPQQYFSQAAEKVQEALNSIRDRINQMGGGNSELIMPQFKPNDQKTKPFWKRLEYGINIQTQGSNQLLPVISDIAVSMGYKINDKSIAGIGVGYKLGFGHSFSHIRISSQGASLRSFVDMKLKGSIWITGGFELNYQQEFARIDQLSQLDVWQKSGLLGLSKKYRIGKKKGNLQLLWDFLSYNQVPRATPVKFRIGYMF